jgi:glucosamine--fructose-6-phosphate aminotransferase (isomerizing)
MNQSILQSEILQQPTVITHLLREERARVQSLVKQLSGRFKYILIAARGTSDNAARYAQYLFQIKNHIPVSLATPSVFSLYQQEPNLDEALVIGISQSGASPDILSVVASARRQKCPTLVITNNPASPLAEAADAVIPLHAEEEKAVAATKTYTSSLAVVALLSAAMAHDERMAAEINQIPAWMEQTIQASMPTIGRMERYRFMEHAVVIGRGFNYATAFEVALKIKELSGVNTMSYSSADFLHGPIATVQFGYPVIAISHTGVVHADMVDVVRKVHGMGAELVLITDDPVALEMAHLPLAIPAGIPEWLSPLVNVIPGQILAWQVALQKGLNVDNPHGLSKITRTY